MSSTLTFLGAAGTVTGSKYLLTIQGGTRVLIDCGMFQGLKKLRQLNWEPFPVPPESISAVLLTHAHSDHCAYLPALVREGFTGPIWCTEGTRRLTEIVLRDAAFLQERDTEDALSGGYSKHNPPLPLYTVADAEKAITQLRTLEFDDERELLPGELTARYVRAGHILGSASIHVSLPDADVVFSGDIGRREHPVLKSRVVPPGAPVVLVESTYGDREHPEPQNLPHEQMADAIRRTIERGGSVLIPAFAVDRTEAVLKELAKMIRDDRIPSVPIYVNSPMALRALEAYSDHADDLRDDIRFDDVASMPNLHTVESTEESRELTRKPLRGAIVISSSGMMSGGRVVHHLAQLLPNRNNCVIVTGFQAAGTRGRSLLDGVTELKMLGEYVPVRAEIVRDEEFSVHADASEVIEWLRELDPAPRIVYCVHGEEDAAGALAEKIHAELGVSAVVPHHGEVVRLDGKAAAEVIAGEPADTADTPGTQPSPAAVPADAGGLAITIDGRPVTGLHLDLETTPDGLALEGFVRILLGGKH